MKIRTKTAALCIFAALSVISGTAAVKSIGGSEEKNYTAPAEETAQVQQGQYYLRECEGYIAVFADAASDTPLTVTDISIGTLTDTDREMLKKGIAAGNKGELLQLLEDFNS